MGRSRPDRGARARVRLPLGALLAGLAAGCADEAPPPAPAARSVARAPVRDHTSRPTIGPYPRSEFLLAHDAFLAADEPRCVPAPQASFLRDDDEVFGIVVAGRARAYAIGMLAYHHVVNDVMAGTPVGVTY